MQPYAASEHLYGWNRGAPTWLPQTRPSPLPIPRNLLAARRCSHHPAWRKQHTDTSHASRSIALPRAPVFSGIQSRWLLRIKLARVQDPQKGYVPHIMTNCDSKWSPSQARRIKARAPCSSRASAVKLAVRGGRGTPCRLRARTRGTSHGPQPAHHVAGQELRIRVGQQRITPVPAP